MELNVKRLIYLLPLLLVACEINPLNSSYLNGGYKDLGTFDTKLDAQNQAVAFILNKYGSLPRQDHYKVRYSFRDARPNEFSRNALWYHKELAELALEVDIHSGSVCRWTDVNETILEQATKSTNSLTRIDSLATPNQPFSQCL